MIALTAVRTSLARTLVTAHLATFLSMTMNAQVSGHADNLKNNVNTISVYDCICTHLQYMQ